jgi:hypothetical protein
LRASRMRTLPGYGFALTIAVIALLSVACASEVSEGQGTLPADTQSNLLPNVDFVGYLYFRPSIPASVDIRRFLPSGGIDILPPETSESAEVSGATILTSTEGDTAGSLEFVSMEDAQRVHELYGKYPAEDAIWSKLDSSTVHVVRGSSAWAVDVRDKLDTGAPDTSTRISIEEKSPESWALMTNLPASEDEPPIAAGLISPDDKLIEDIETNVGVDVSDLDVAFGNIGAQRLAYAIYGDAPIDVTREIDFRFLTLHDVGMVIVGETNYPGFALSFVVSAISGRIGMETIDLGNTNARYLETEHAHVVLKNKGNLIYAALADDRRDAEQLMLRALAD